MANINKPESLRSHLLSTITELKHNPDRLLIFIDNDKVRCTSAASLRYSFNLQINLTDFAGDPDSVMLPLPVWPSVHRYELLGNPSKSAGDIQIGADI